MDTITLTDSRIPATALDREPSAEQLTPRCNIPINLNNWDALPEETREELTWFHQHIFDDNLTNAEAAKALGYDWTVVFRALKGTYEGNWENIRKAVVKYRSVLRERKKIQNVEFVPNKNTRLICRALDYAVASNTITLIIGPSRFSKTMAVKHWRDLNNSGRTIYVAAPVVCNPRSLLTAICTAIGRKPGTYEQMASQVEKALNKGRTLLVDEAHFTLPKRSSDPVCLEILRTLHDRTKCGLGLIATARFGDNLVNAEYQYEQLLGRIGLACRLYRTLAEDDIIPLIEQYFIRATDFLIESCLDIVNDKNPDIKGRLGSLVEIFRDASRISSDARGKKKMTEQHFKDALAVRKQMMGEFQYAKH